MKILSIIGISAAVILASSTAYASPNNPHKDKSLPPGIEKKYERTGELPPGWENS